MPPAGAPNVAAFVSMRPEVHPELGSVPECSARKIRCPLPSRNTFDVLLVIVSISPVPNVEPGPVSYFQALSTPVPAAPLKSSLQVKVHPVGGAGAAAAGPPVAMRPTPA